MFLWTLNTNPNIKHRNTLRPYRLIYSNTIEKRRNCKSENHNLCSRVSYEFLLYGYSSLGNRLIIYDSIFIRDEMSHYSFVQFSFHFVKREEKQKKHNAKKKKDN